MVLIRSLFSGEQSNYPTLAKGGVNALALVLNAFWRTWKANGLCGEKNRLGESSQCLRSIREKLAAQFARMGGCPARRSEFTSRHKFSGCGPLRAKRGEDAEFCV